jgi:hypothetical protein
VRTHLLRELDQHGTRLETFGTGDIHNHETAVVAYLYRMGPPSQTGSTNR